MKIAIDISSVVYKTGVSHYTENLVSNLLKVDKRNEYILFGFSLRRHGELVEFADSLKGNFTTKFLRIPPSLMEPMFNDLRFPSIEAFVGSVDVFHSSDWTQARSSAFKVTTVHDLGFLKFPGLQHPKIEKVSPKRLKLVKRDVDRIIVPSNMTKSDLVSVGFVKEKVRVIAEAANFTKASKEDAEKIKKKYGLKRKFLLGVGVNPRKNTTRIVEAYNILRKTHDLDIVFYGTPSHVNITQGNGVRLLGRVSDKDAAALNTAAEVVVYPSLYEGFGLPVLDAFACETPVVTSNTSSLPEVADEAAVLVDPESVEDIVRGIKEAIARSKELVAKGKKHVSNYSWEKMAKETLAVYEE